MVKVSRDACFAPLLVTPFASGESSSGADQEKNCSCERVAAYWTKRLNSSSIAERREAVTRIGYFAHKATAAVPFLIKALDDPDRELAISAVVALGRIRLPAAAVFPGLISKLDEERLCTREREFGSEVAPFGDPLAIAIARTGDASVTALITTLRTGAPLGRGRAATALGLLKPPPLGALPALIDGLRDGDAIVRLDSAWALGQIGADARAAIPALEAGLRDEEDYRTPNASMIVLTLTKLGAPPVEMFERAVVNGRFTESDALSRVGLAGSSVVPALINALKDKRYDVRIEALGALGRLGVAATPAVPALSEYVKSNGSIDVDEAFSLEQIGTVASPLIPLLLKLLPTLPHDSAVAVVRALLALDADGVETLPAFLKVLESDAVPNKNEDPPLRSVRSEICVAIGFMGSSARKAVPVLLKVAQAQGDRARIDAIVALGRIGRPAGSAMQPLIRLTYSGDPIVAVESIDALGRVGVGSRDSVPRLTQLVRSPDLQTRLWSIRALGRLGPAAVESVPALWAELRDPKTFVPSAVWALLRIDPAARQEAERLFDRTTAESLGSGVERMQIWLAEAALHRNCPEISRAVGGLINEIEAVLDQDGWLGQPSPDWLEYVRPHFDALQDLREAARPAIPRLRELPKVSNHPVFRKWVADAIESASE